MKKYIILLLGLLLCGCNNILKPQKIEENVIEKKEEVVDEIIEEEVYNDLNPIKLGLYDNVGKKYILYNNFTGSFLPKKDVVTFQIVPKNESEIVYSGNRQDYIKGLWDEIETNYTLGIKLEYTLTSGEIIKHVLYDPTNILAYQDYIQVYMYDAIYHKNDKWYSHITKEEFNENTYITSFKLTAGPKIDEVVFPIKLDVFTYDSEDDFKDGEYRGNSIWSIELFKE